MLGSNRPCYLPLLWALNDRSARVVPSEGDSGAGLSQQQQSDGGSMASSMKKILLLRNQKTGAWKYTERANPDDFKAKSWPGYEYYGFHKDVHSAMEHAGKVETMLKQKLNPGTQHMFAGSCCDDPKPSECGG